jgi:hypothetical protein
MKRHLMAVTMLTFVVSGNALAQTRGPGLLYATAFRGSNGHLWIDSSFQYVFAGDTGGAVVPGTSPAIARRVSGTSTGYVVAFQGNPNNHLWLTQSMGSKSQTGTDTLSSMAPNTSPSIATLTDNTFAVAYQSPQNELWLYLSSGSKIHAICTPPSGYCKMNPGTNPSIAPLPDGSYEVVFEAPPDAQKNTFLSSYSPSSGYGYTGNWYFGMLSGTSPSITWTPNYDDWAVAFNSNVNNLWIVDDWSFQDQSNRAMAGGSSPSIAYNSASTYIVAYQTPSFQLCTWAYYGGAGTGCTGLTMKQYTSPSISASADATRYMIAAQGADGYLYYAGTFAGSLAKTSAYLNNSSSPSVVFLN